MSLLLNALSIVAPAECLICGRQGHDLCPVCLQDLPEPLPERCWRCQKLALGSKTCSTCYRHSSIKHAWVASEYQNGMKKAIHSFKFERQRGLSRPLSQILKERLPLVRNGTIVVHVPTATTRRRVRGYDHAELLAKELSRLLELKHIPLLRRQTQTRQVGARRQTRLEQLEGAFRVIRLEYVKNQNILLVDDVLTTGATLTACARQLRQASAKSVSAVVLAQKS